MESVSGLVGHGLKAKVKIKQFHDWEGVDVIVSVLQWKRVVASREDCIPHDSAVFTEAKGILREGNFHPKRNARFQRKVARLILGELRIRQESLYWDEEEYIGDIL
ncbi:MAG: hypothetical protein AAB794_02045 [Patescibacteria group bacterium]